jgi:hypothetical protein
VSKRKGPEALLQAAIIDRLAYDRGVLLVRVNAGRIVVGEGKSRRMYRGAEAGTSDLLLCVYCAGMGCYADDVGRFCALEVKAPRGKATEAQAAFLERVRELGGFGAVVRSVDEALAAVERCRNGEQD